MNFLAEIPDWSVQHQGRQCGCHQAAIEEYRRRYLDTGQFLRQLVMTEICQDRGESLLLVGISIAKEQNLIRDLLGLNFGLTNAYSLAL